jgi:hypothetical protein
MNGLKIESILLNERAYENRYKVGYECKREKSTNESKGKPEQKFDAACGTILE